jgi:gamma-glutamyltranspeptidase/glutathione hydrolase
MTKNQRKVLSLILVIIAVVFGALYISSGGRMFQLKPKIASISANDIWSGEPFSSFRDLKTVTAKKHLISTSNQLASQVGERILDEGGNAIDAAIAAQMVLNLVEPQSSGIGGGAFLLYYDAKTKTSRYFNGRETAPKNSHNKMFLNEDGTPKEFNDAVRGGLSVGTPGLLKVLKEVHKKYGKLEWEELFKPAIELSNEGFPMDERIRVIASHIGYLKNSENFAKMYLNEDGKPKDLGTIIYNKDLAKTFSIIAKEGIKPFYEGQIAKNIVQTVQNSSINPGYLSLEDLKNYKTIEGNLICRNYRLKYKICSMPLPSSGGITVLQALGILENFDLPNLKPGSLQAIHLISEAVKLSYADRNKYVADVDYVPIQQMLDKNYLKKRSKLIRKNKAMGNVSAGEFNIEASYQINQNAKELPSTTHLSIIDKYGNAIALTSTIEYYFGSTLNVNGFILNNQLTDFSFLPEINGKPVANRIEPGKQPRSSMSPTFVFDKNDNLIMIVGSPGGPRIIQYVLKTIIAHLDWKLDIQESISLPNFVTLNNVIELEKKTKLTKLKSKLEKMGHNVIINDLVSGIHAITINNKTLKGGADPRRGGLAIGK